ncbi:MAG: hypothetical protein ACOH2F_11295 [Cellulomonas sp.]
MLHPVAVARPREAQPARIACRDDRVPLNQRRPPNAALIGHPDFPFSSSLTSEGGACRKAAHEARRTGAPGAFEVKVVERVVVESHDLAGCVARVIASPAACRRVLQALAALAADGTLVTDPKWRPTQEAAKALGAVVSAPTSRLMYRRK